ncbi:MAG: class I SAM-dependent methyltransferase [Acidobacteria bacterium]|nr:MAG: class I SAM-dependent methyltransferase [Acidobacteriota bacterium]
MVKAPNFDAAEAQLERCSFVPGAMTYDRCMSERFLTGRALSSEAAATWRKAIAPFVPRDSAFTIVDVGAGTCRFLPVLQAFTGARVVCIEPSFEMLVAGVRENGVSNALYVVGKGESIPLESGSCGLVWLSQSYHHVTDRAGLVDELRRIVTPAGCVLIRNSFSDRLDGFPTLFRFFPSALQLCTALPTVAETVRIFEEHGFILDTDQEVEQQTCGSLREFAERSRMRADSSLALLSDDEFQSGLDSLSREVELESEPAAVIEKLSLLAFRLREAA